jgi:hypothetical protein
MATVRLIPGSISTQAFNLGSIAALSLACAAFGACLWYGVMTPLELVLSSVVVLPPYQLLVACVLGRWLGLGPDGNASRHAG